MRTQSPGPDKDGNDCDTGRDRSRTDSNTSQELAGVGGSTDERLTPGKLLRNLCPQSPKARPHALLCHCIHSGKEELRSSRINSRHS